MFWAICDLERVGHGVGGALGDRDVDSHPPPTCAAGSGALNHSTNFTASSEAFLAEQPARQAAERVGRIAVATFDGGEGQDAELVIGDARPWWPSCPSWRRSPSRPSGASRPCRRRNSRRHRRRSAARKPSCNGSSAASCRKYSPALTKASPAKPSPSPARGGLEALLASETDDQLGPPEVSRPLVLGAERERGDARILELLHGGEEPVPGLPGSQDRRRPVRTGPCCTTARLRATSRATP